MATIIWCDRARYVVAEPRTEVQRRIATASTLPGREPEPEPEPQFDPITGEAYATLQSFDPGDRWVYFTRAVRAANDRWLDPEGTGQQVCLNTRLISAFEAVPGHGI